MTPSNKNGLFRPWDEDSSETSCVVERLVENVNYLRVDVKSETTEETQRSDFSPSPVTSTSGSSSHTQDAEEEDSLHKLTSLVDRTLLGLPPSDSSIDSSSCSEASFPPQSPVEDLHRSAFAPACLAHSVAYQFPAASFSGFPGHFQNGGLLHQDILGRRDHVAFEHFAAQQGQFALEEAARLLQQHEALIKQNKKLRPKKFRCPHCDIAFSNNGQLKGHIRIHTGERPFKCEEDGCGKTFTRNEELTRHKRIHSGSRPHACLACGKRFGRKDHLKKHARTHEMRGPAIYIPAPGPFPFPAHAPLHHPFLYGL